MKAEDQSAEREALLKPCPFCGSSKLFTNHQLQIGERWVWAQCGNCGTQGPCSRDSTRSTAAWNTRAALSAREAPATEQRLWLWKNFVDGRPEYWAFDNPYPCVTVWGDPLTLGEPCGYAILKESVNGRPNRPEAEVIATVTRMHATDPAPPAAKAVEMDATRAAMALALEAMQDALEDAQLAQSEYDGRTYSFCTSCGADDLQTPTVGKHTPHCAWGKVRAAISELELQIAALSKQGGNHG